MAMVKTKIPTTELRAGDVVHRGGENGKRYTVVNVDGAASNDPRATAEVWLRDRFGGELSITATNRSSWYREDVVPRV